MEILVVVLEIIGTVAFAVSGALVAVEKKMDIFGVAILGLVTATGGGVLRDVILGILPPRTFTNPVYALVALGTALVMFFPVLRRAKGGYKIFMDKLLLVMDSLGLAIFTVVGMRIAVDAGFQVNYFLLIFVGVVTGVGGGIILNGKMVAGVNGAGGEIGHMTMDTEETVVCGCGKCGCLEQYASATGIVRMAKKALAESDKESALRDIQELTAKDVFDAAKNGDGLALEQVEELGRKLGLAAAQIACVVDPEVFVIGGGVSRAGRIILDVTEKYFRKYAFHACRETKFELAALGNDGGIYGGARAVLE